jgi:Lysyl oxidase
MRRALWFAGAVAALLAVPAQAFADQRLPDLGMARFTKIYIDTTTMPGHSLLRYTATLVNVGAGPLQFTGTRTDTSTPTMSVTQRIFNSDGTYSDVATPLTMIYAGDGHNHWHTQDIETGQLARLDNGTAVGRLAKHGFCFSDTLGYNLTLPGAPQAKVYTPAGCSPNNPAALTTTMGLSIGWGDRYGAATNLQWIDITGLPDGKYQLTATADPTSGAVESNYTNNTVYANLLITGGASSLTVLKKGPGA